MQAQYFKATKRTRRFNENQKVWIRYAFSNHMEVWFKWRGRGRYVSGLVGRWHPCVGEIKVIDVDDAFAQRIAGSYIKYWV